MIRKRLSPAVKSLRGGNVIRPELCVSDLGDVKLEEFRHDLVGNIRGQGRLRRAACGINETVCKDLTEGGSVLLFCSRLPLPVGISAYSGFVLAPWVITSAVVPESANGVTEMWHAYEHKGRWSNNRLAGGALIELNELDSWRLLKSLDDGQVPNGNVSWSLAVVWVFEDKRASRT